MPPPPMAVPGIPAGELTLFASRVPRRIPWDQPKWRRPVRDHEALKVQGKPSPAPQNGTRPCVPSMGAGAIPTEAVPGGTRRRANAFRKPGTPSDPRRLDALGPAVVGEARPGPGGTSVVIVRDVCFIFC